MTTLAFAQYTLDDTGSVARIFAGTEELCGIYILGFADGTKYVGQTKNVVRRVAQHRHTRQGIVELSFASCSEADLDRLERETIREMQKNHVLRNKLLMHLPGGEGDFTLTIEERTTVSLPTARETRKRLTEKAEPTRENFWKLLSHPQYPALRQVLGEYVDAVIADPLTTEKFLWTVSALSSTARGPRQRGLATISCGNLETLVISEWPERDGFVWGGFLNVASEALTTSQRISLESILSIDTYRADYRQRSDVLTIAFEDLDTLSELLSIPEVINAAYRLNIGMMRQGSTMYRRFHNSYLADDVINHAAAQLLAAAQDKAEPTISDPPNPNLPRKQIKSSRASRSAGRSRATRRIR